MKKGILIVRRTKKGKIFVQLDRMNGKPPMPLSYVRFEDTSLNQKECTYETNKKGIISTISVGGKVVWKREQPKATPNSHKGGRTPSSQIQKKDAFSLEHTLLPADVRKLNSQLQDIDNFALKFHKAARYDLDHRKDKYKFWFYKYDYRKKTSYEIRPNFDRVDFKAIIQRQQQQIQKAFPKQSINFSLPLQWRMVIGLGGESVYETGMTLHAVYGIPYIPASSIKGVMRSWIISQLFENSEVKAISNSSLFCALFGCPKEAGKGKNKVKSALGHEFQGSLRFFDAFPSDKPQLTTDIMNVHYKDWYKEIGYKPPTDTQSPNPIYFLTVDKANDIQFNFHIAITDNPKLADFKLKPGSTEDFSPYLPHHSLSLDSSLLDIAKYWLEQALTQHGIGAKTAVGYGYLGE